MSSFVSPITALRPSFDAGTVSRINLRRRFATNCLRFASRALGGTAILPDTRTCRESSFLSTAAARCTAVAPTSPIGTSTTGRRAAGLTAEDADALRQATSAARTSGMANQRINPTVCGARTMSTGTDSDEPHGEGGALRSRTLGQARGQPPTRHRISGRAPQQGPEQVKPRCARQSEAATTS